MAFPVVFRACYDDEHEDCPKRKGQGFAVALCMCPCHVEGTSVNPNLKFYEHVKSQGPYDG